MHLKLPFFALEKELCNCNFPDIVIRLTNGIVVPEEQRTFCLTFKYQGLIFKNSDGMDNLGVQIISLIKKFITKIPKQTLKQWRNKQKCHKIQGDNNLYSKTYH